ncbi:hypothetical protein F511_11264 [Dorcoceras hygrometricum]|uniref:Uncharacterized protein n=1 Tax=Dorcoceras hygrometricum TaxID=472368 RepID=A0A2Z7CCE0_9LAMI|nr:hypothetical protein F511_11264 [Dorcoceras hygrometricum]
MGIDQLKIHYVQPGYLKNLLRPTQTHVAQNREKKQGAATQSTIRGQWYSGTTTQTATTSKAALNLSGTMAQPTNHNVQRNSALKGIRPNIADQIWVSDFSYRVEDFVSELIIFEYSGYFSYRVRISDLRVFSFDSESSRSAVTRAPAE